MPPSSDPITLSELRSMLRELADNAGAVARQPEKKDITALIDAYRAEKLVLVLGAGVSVDLGLLDWSTLLQKLLITTIVHTTQEDTERSNVLAKLFNKVFQPNPLIAARYLNNFYRNEFKDEPLAFNNAVRDTLYSGLTKDDQSALLQEIRQFCIAPGKSPNLRSIITYNYDDIIERDLKNAGVDVPIKSIHAPGMHAESDELAIYHVHGFLPRSGALGQDNQIILSEDFYHQQYGDVYGWSNLVQINTFKEAKCLFIGTSFTDPNQRRLLEIAKTLRGDNTVHHYCIRKRYEIAKVEHALKKVLDDEPTLLDEKQRTDLTLETTVKELIQVMENFEEQDLRSFGVGTIWVDAYANIPAILQQIRKMHPT
jgi:SIR2-like domain